MNKFIITTPAYNVAKWIAMYVNTLKFQSYKNFEVHFVDDASTDNTVSLLTNMTKDDSRFHIYTNTQNIGSPLENIIKAFDHANPEDDDIIVNIDGDDWLSSVFVLDYLNQIYTHTNCWMTYGTCQIYPTGDVVGHSEIPMPDWVSDQNAYRQYPFIASHLRSYKAKLFRHIDRLDFVDRRSNKVYTEASDLALMFPLLEMSGKDRAYRVESIMYTLNRNNELNEATLDCAKQKETESIIRSCKSYDRIQTI